MKELFTKECLNFLTGLLSILYKIYHYNNRLLYKGRKITTIISINILGHEGKYYDKMEMSL